MAQSPSPQELLHAALATQLGLMTLQDAEAALANCEANAEKSLRKTIVDGQRLSSSQDELVAKLLEAYLAANPDEARRNLTLLEQTPHLSSAIDLLTSHRFEATVSFDGSRTEGRRPGDAQDISMRVTPSGERFRSLKLHAAGGLGEVHLARDEQIKRDVALKQLQEKHADDPLKRERFVLEAEVTGALEHPGIVPVYALGIDAHGRPFYAMRFVRGESLRNAVLRWQKTTKANERYRRDAIELRRLLARFISVCQAMEYAHSRGVIHRDLKPANIMLGKHGETYVVDWGLARVAGDVVADPALDGEEKIRADQLSGFSGTMYGSIIGTPAYMSPEQAAGASRSVGPPADIYSLGATLYHLLTGQPPYLVEDKSPRSFMKTVERGQFPPPRNIVPQTPRELDAICVRAMELVPADRYASAEQLALDVERWLADEPVEACPPRLIEKAARWGRKHRTAAVVGGVALALIALGASGAAIALDRAADRERQLAADKAAIAEDEARARDEADRRFLEARETVDAWLTGFSEALTHFPGVAQFRRAMLERAAAQYEEFVSQRGDDPAMQLERGRTLVRLGDLRRSLEEPSQALDAYRRALDVFVSIPADEDAEAEWSIAWADAQGRVGVAHADQNNSDAAEKAFAAAIERLTPLVDGADGKLNSDAAAALAAVEINQAGFFQSVGRHDDALDALTAATARLRRLLAVEPDVLNNRMNLAAGELGLGRVMHDRGDATAAAERFRAAVQAYTAAADLHPDDPVSLDRKAAAHMYLAAAEARRGDDLATAGAYAEAAADYERLVAAQPDAIVYIDNLALVQTDLGQLLRELGDGAAAEKSLATAKQKLMQLVGLYPGTPRFHEEAAIAIDSLADVQLALDHADLAVVDAELAVQTFRRLAETYPDEPAYRERLAVALCHEGQARARLGDLTADERFREAISQLDQLIAQHPDVPSHRNVAALAHFRRGDVLLQRGEAEDAATAFTASADHWKQLVNASQDAAYLDRAAWFFATCPVVEQRDLALAERSATQASAAAPANERMRATLAMVQVRGGRADEALELLDLAPERLSEAHGKALLVASLAMHASGNQDEARRYLQLGEEWLAAHVPGDWDLTLLRDECRKELGAAGAPAESDRATPAEEAAAVAD